MRAAIVTRYGAPDVMRVGEVPRPSPGRDQVLVRVLAAAVTSADARVRGARFPPGFGPFARLAFGLTRPRRRVLGGTFSGEVVATGRGVDRVAVGDEVCGMTGLAMGTHAEYAAVKADKLVRKPSTVSHEDAAGVLFGGSTALYYLRDRATLEVGTTVLVNGASGAIGTNAVQLAKHLGATVTELGADRVIDHTRTDLAEVDDRFDVVLDAVGNVSIAAGRHLLTDRGVLLLAVASLSETIRARGNVAAGAAPERPEDLEYLLGLVAAGELTVVLDAVHHLDEIIAAYERVDSGHKVGNIVVRPEPDE